MQNSFSLRFPTFVHPNEFYHTDLRAVRLGKFSRVMLIAAVLLSLAARLSANSITPVTVTVDTSTLLGDSAQLAFDFIGGPDANMITVTDFSTDGSLGAVFPTGEVSGTLPGTVTLTDALPADFFNEYLTDITLGNTFSFVLGATTTGPPDGSFPDAFSLFILDATTGLSLVTTSDPTGSDSLLTLSIDGSPEGELNNFGVTVGPGSTPPVSAVPEPDSLLLLTSGIAVLALAVRHRVSLSWVSNPIKS